MCGIITAEIRFSIEFCIDPSFVMPMSISLHRIQSRYGETCTTARPDILADQPSPWGAVQRLLDILMHLILITEYCISFEKLVNDSSAHARSGCPCTWHTIFGGKYCRPKYFIRQEQLEFLIERRIFLFLCLGKSFSLYWPSVLVSDAWES